MDNTLEVQFIKDNSLVKENNISGWIKPTDSDKIYDPYVELTFEEFCKLTLNEQVEYLLASTEKVMKDWTLFDATIGIELPNDNTVSIALVKDDIGPRRVPLLDRYGGYSSSQGDLNYGKYLWTTLVISDVNGQHNIKSNSMIFRTVIIGLLLSFLVKFRPEKYTEFANASSYYATALILGQNKPYKYRASIL